MKILQAIKIKGSTFNFVQDLQVLKNPLVLVFGNRYMLQHKDLYKEVRTLFPNGHLVFGTTSGEIMDANVYDGTVVLTAIEFEKSTFLVKAKNVVDFGNDDKSLGQQLMSEFSQEGLRHIFIVSEGSSVNGSALIHGLEINKFRKVGLSGGLCGDDDRFELTLSSYNEPPKEGQVVAIGFYGDSLEITSANFGGWTAFGPERPRTISYMN